jgi:hypothetical protein
MHYEFSVHITKDEPIDRKKLMDKFTNFLTSREPVGIHLRPVPVALQGPV